MASSGEKRRQQLMAKARREKYLSPSERAELTSGQIQKLYAEKALVDIKPQPSYGTTVVNGQTFLSSINGVPTFGFGGAGSGGGGGDDGNKRPAFTTGYTPDSVYNDTLASIAARRQMALNAATEGERGLSNDYGLGINQDASGATYTGQWAASDPNQLGIDPSNPFSRASLLNKSYFVAGKVGEGSYANRGLLTSGAYQRNQNRDAFRFEGGKDSLLKSFASQLQDYRQRRAQAEADARAAQQQASYDLFNRRRDEYDRNYGLNG